MRKKIQKKMYEFCFLLELMISVIIGATVIILGARLLVSAFGTAVFGNGEKMLEGILDRALILAIGVEFIKMLCRHTPETVIEVLVFAIARQLVIIHKSAWETLVEIAAIALLFAVRRFLLTPADENDKHEFLRYTGFSTKAIDCEVENADD